MSISTKAEFFVIFGAILCSCLLAYLLLLRPFYRKFRAFCMGFYTHSYYIDPNTGKKRLYFKSKFSEWFHLAIMNFASKVIVFIAIVFIVFVRLDGFDGYALTKPEYIIGEQVLFFNGTECSLEVGEVTDLGDLKNGWVLQTANGLENGIIVGTYVPYKVSIFTLPAIALFSVTSRIHTIITIVLHYALL